MQNKTHKQNNEDETALATTARATLGVRHRRIALLLGTLAVSMLGLAYAAVPLYQIFCQVTGYGGTTQRVVEKSATVSERTITIRFDANVSPALAWSFKPAQQTVKVKLGENVLAFYSAENFSNETTRGTATFNVTPEIAGSYFNKIECFCFTEQVLHPGQSAEMPVTFFVDPDILNDPSAKGISEITLSYTFFPAKPRDLSMLAPNYRAGKLANRLIKVRGDARTRQGQHLNDSPDGA